MKAERKIDFRPITITLETEKEIELMTHILNCGTDKSLMEYAEEQGVNGKELNSFHYHAWDVLNSCIVYH